MVRRLRALALFLIVVVPACGGGSAGPAAVPTAPTPPSPPPTSIIASGENWSFRLDGFGDVGITGGYGKSVPLAALEGAFNASEGSVGAVMQPFGRCFVSDGNQVRFTGTRSAGAAVTLESQAQGGQVVRITASLGASGDTLQGTYTIMGGCGAGATGSLLGRRVNLTGSWRGTMGQIPVHVDLQMATAPDPDGNFTLSGPVRFSDTTCFVDAVVTRRARGRVLFPDVVSQTQRLELIAELAEDLTTLHVIYVLVTGVCPELRDGSGRLLRE